MKRQYVEVVRVEDALILLRRSSALRPDPVIPGACGLGLDLPQTARMRGWRCYAIDAPAAVQHRDARGRIVQREIDSPRVRKHFYRQHQVEPACCAEYLAGKWPDAVEPQERLQARISALPARMQPRIAAPVILLARGGGGSRLLALLAEDCGLFLGCDRNISSDTLDLVPAIYQAIYRKYRSLASWQRELTVPHLRVAAAAMVARQPSRTIAWGFKTPESLLLLPELDAAFPQARYLHLVRDPVGICLRTPRLTAMPDQPIGAVALRAAYQDAGRDLHLITTDAPAVRMAYTTYHQVRIATEYCRGHFKPDRYQELRFEEVVEHPDAAVAAVGSWLGVRPRGRSLRRSIDLVRAHARDALPAEIVAQVRAIVAPLNQLLGYR